MTDHVILKAPEAVPQEASAASRADALSFEQLRPPSRANWYLMAPSGLCRMVKPHTISPMFEVPANRLAAAFEKMVAGEPRAEIVARSEHTLELRQRSRFFRFPDLVDVRFIPRGDDRSTLAIYSRSRFGVSDFGANRLRIRDWLSKTAGILATGHGAD